MTTPEQNKENCREFAQRVFNEHDITFAEKWLSDDFIDRCWQPSWRRR